MTRYFFDLKSHVRSIYDYKGDDFLNSQAACEYAEMIALDLKHRLNADWTGWSVEVRSAHGEKLLSLPVTPPELIAAQVADIQCDSANQSVN